MCRQVCKKHFFPPDLCSYHHQHTNIKSLFVTYLNLADIWLNVSRWKFEIREPQCLLLWDTSLEVKRQSYLPVQYVTRDLKSSISVEVLLSRCHAHFLANSSRSSPGPALISPLSPWGGDYTIHVLLQLISTFFVIPVFLPSHLWPCFVSPASVNLATTTSDMIHCIGLFT